MLIGGLVYNISGFLALLPFVSQFYGWQLVAISNLTLCCIFYITADTKTHDALLIIFSLLVGHIMYRNWFGYYGQMTIQNLLLASVVYFSWLSYRTTPKYNYYAKMLSGVLCLQHLINYCINTSVLVFCTPQAHSDPLQLMLYKSTGISYNIVFGTLLGLILMNAYLFHHYPRIAAKDFDPKKSHVLHFLPMHDGARTWLIFLFSMLPIPHYAVYGFHEIRLEWGIWKYSKKENGLVFHPLSSGKLDSLFRRGLILICEPVKIRHRLEPLEGNVPYNIWTGETCHKLAKYIKGELPFDDKWFKIARS